MTDPQIKITIYIYKKNVPEPKPIYVIKFGLVDGMMVDHFLMLMSLDELRPCLLLIIVCHKRP